MTKHEAYLKDMERFKNSNEDGKSYAYIVDDKGEYHYYGENKVLIGGMQLIAKYLYGINKTSANSIDITTLDSALTGLLPTTGEKLDSEIFGLLFSTEGGDLSTTYSVEQKDKGFDITKILPHIQVDEADDTPSVYMAGYEMREVKDGKVNYYVKKPTAITLENLTVDGEVLSDNPDVTLSRSIGVVSRIVVEVAFDTQDFAGWFANNADPNKRYFNSVAILFGDKYNVVSGVDTYVEHRNVICTNKYHREPINLGKYDTIQSFVIHRYSR